MTLIWVLVFILLIFIFYYVNKFYFNWCVLLSKSIFVSLMFLKSFVKHFLHLVTSGYILLTIDWLIDCLIDWLIDWWNFSRTLEFCCYRNKARSTFKLFEGLCITPLEINITMTSWIMSPFCPGWIWRCWRWRSIKPDCSFWHREQV